MLRKEQLARRRGRPDAELRERLDALRARRDKQLRELGVKYGKRLEELYAAWAFDRLEVWADFDRRWDELLRKAGEEDRARVPRSLRGARAAG